VTVFIHIVLAIGAGSAAGQLLAGGTDVVIVLRVEDKVMTREEAALGCAGGVRLGDAGQHPGSLAGQHLLAVEVAAVGQGRDLLAARGGLRLQPHRLQLGSVMAQVGHLVRYDQVVLGVYGGLHIVADHARAPSAGRHGARIRIGQRDLLVRRSLDLLLHRLQGLHLTAKAGDLLGDLLGPGLGDVTVLAIGMVQGRQVTGDAGVHLLHPLGDLGHSVVLVAVVDRLELAAVDGDDGLGEQVQPAA